MQPFNLQAGFITLDDASGTQGVVIGPEGEDPFITLAVYGELTTERKRAIIQSALALIQACMPPGTTTEAQIKPVLAIADEDVHAHVGEEGDA